MAKLHNKTTSNVLVVRKIDNDVYKRFKQKAIEENKTIGEAINQAMDYWIKKKEEQKGHAIKGLLNINGFIQTGGEVKWSEEVDESLYGDSS